MSGRPRNFTSGRMRYRVDLQKHVDTQDDTGQPVSSWTSVAKSIPSDYEAVSGGQLFRGTQIQEGISAVFTMRHRTDVDTSQRILFRGTAFGIVFAKQVSGRDRYLELHCRAVP